MVLATVPEAPPTTRNQRATSCPAPVSAKEPKVDESRFRVSALRCVSSFSMEGIAKLQSAELQRDTAYCCQPPPSARYSCTRLWYSVPRAPASVSSAEKRDRWPSKTSR